MPIYDQGYQRWGGEIPARPLRWWPIVRQGVWGFLPQRKYLILLGLAWISMIFQGATLYARLKGADLLESMIGRSFEAGPSFYWDALQGQSLWVLILTVLVGSDLIAADRRFKALQLYFSKPITPNDYILGKLGVIGAFLTIVVWLPGILLWLFGLMLEPSMAYFGEIWYVPLAVTAYSLLLIASAGLLMLATSAIGQRAVFIGVTWIIFFGYGPFQLVIILLKGITGQEIWGLLGVAGNLAQVGAWWFGADRPHEFHPAFSLITLLAVCGLCYVVLRRRIRPVEVVL